MVTICLVINVSANDLGGKVLVELNCARVVNVIVLISKKFLLLFKKINKSNKMRLLFFKKK